jgi:hypothetical protein
MSMYTLGIPKLVDILNEQESPQDNDNLEDAQGIIDKLNNILSLWQTKKYETDKQRWEEYYLDISELVQDWEEETSMKGIALDSPLNESIKKLVKKEIQKLLK